MLNTARHKALKKHSAAMKGENEMDFYLYIAPPTVTAQEHKIRIVGGRPMFYDTPKLKAARATFESLLRKHVPAEPIEGPVELTVEWRFATKTHKDGTYRVTRPDTDNLQKLLKDCMTRVGFWKDGAHPQQLRKYRQTRRPEPGRWA